jgi:hypothetical protein
MRVRRINGIDIQDGLTGQTQVEQPTGGFFGVLRQAIAPRPPPPRRPVLGPPPQRKCNCPGGRR